MQFGVIYALNIKVNIPPQAREAFTSAIASSGSSKQETQPLKQPPAAHAQSYAAAWRVQQTVLSFISFFILFNISFLLMVY